MTLRETAVTNKEKFDITMEEYEKTVDYIVYNSNCENIDTRIIDDMEKNMC